MKRPLLILLASLVATSVLPGAALARDHHGRHHDRRHEARRHAARRDSRRHDRRHSSDRSGIAGARQEGTGTVMSVAGGMLTIRLENGSVVSGAVTDGTELKCESSAPRARVADGNGGGQDNAGSEDNGSDENSGSRDDGPGDDSFTRRDDNGDQNDAAEMCAASELAPGTAVREAELRASNAGPVWQEVTLDV